MKQILVITVLLITTTPFLYGQTKSRKGNTNRGTERELLERNKEYDKALVREDVSALDRIFADEFIYTSRIIKGAGIAGFRTTTDYTRYRRFLTTVEIKDSEEDKN